ncbi:MAG: antibiotic biosynthesis monooxygenase [Armatimonadota bacterium]|nr:antibiotic biosynthesis monooxygenase [Armatimonadota bacterium]
MYVVLVHVRVKEENIDDFVKATLENATESVKEPGNRRFDVLQSSEDPCRFILYEAWGSPEDAAAHKNTPHYQKWRDTVADWMAEPRRGTEYTSLFP